MPTSTRRSRPAGRSAARSSSATAIAEGTAMKKGRPRPPFFHALKAQSRIAPLALLDLRLPAQVGHELLDLLLLGALLELLLEVLELGDLQGAHVIHADHVVAEVGLYRRLRDLALGLRL